MIERVETGFYYYIQCDIAQDFRRVVHGSGPLLLWSVWLGAPGWNCMEKLGERVMQTDSEIGFGIDEYALFYLKLRCLCSVMRRFLCQTVSDYVVE